jgi:hypothetical protein
MPDRALQGVWEEGPGDEFFADVGFPGVGTGASEVGDAQGSDCSSDP